MAGDWIPVQDDLPGRREILQLAAVTKRRRHEVLGLLIHLWGWASRETVDGTIPGVLVTSLPDLIGADHKFWSAVIEAGWLVADNNGITIPNADRWISQGAKARLQDKYRKQVSRSDAGALPTSVRTNVRSAADKRPVENGQTSHFKPDLQNRTEQNNTNRNFDEGGDSWPGAVSKRGLGSAAGVERLWQIALKAGVCQQSDAARLGFEASAITALRSGKNPSALFVSMVKARAWESKDKGPSEADFIAASKRLRPAPVTLRILEGQE